MGCSEVPLQSATWNVSDQRTLTAQYGRWQMNEFESGDNASTGQSSSDPVECPFCGHVTVPNQLSDASYVCSCPAQRALPTTDIKDPALMPSPVDDSSFVAPIHQKPESLPDDKGQFGRDVQTEAYKPLRSPPGS